MKNPTISDSL